MGYQERVELYRKIEELRERPLIAYVTSSRPNATGKAVRRMPGRSVIMSPWKDHGLVTCEPVDTADDGSEAVIEPDWLDRDLQLILASAKEA